MREIKFRGKSELAHQWRYGSLIMIDKHPHIVEDCEIGLDGHHIRQTSDRPTWIIPETLGQFTGLCDKNGTEIYEGDIVSHPYIDPIFRAIVDGSSVKSKVVFHDGAFVVNYDVDDFILLDAFIREGHVEVIGNIHDNPELLTTSK